MGAFIRPREVRAGCQIVSQQAESLVFSLSPQTFGANLECWSCTQVWDSPGSGCSVEDVRAGSKESKTATGKMEDGGAGKGSRQPESHDITQRVQDAVQTRAAAASPSLSAMKPSALFSHSFSSLEMQLSRPPVEPNDDKVTLHATGALAHESPVALLFSVAERAPARDMSQGMQRTYHAATVSRSVRHTIDRTSAPDMPSVIESATDRGLNALHVRGRMEDESLKQGTLGTTHVSQGEEWLVLPSSGNVTMCRPGQIDPSPHNKLHVECELPAPGKQNGTESQGRNVVGEGPDQSEAFSERRSRSPLEEGRRRAEVARANAVS